MRLSIATKVFLGFTLVLLAFLGVSLHAISRFQAIGQLLHLVNEGYLPLTRSVTQLEKVHESQSSDVAKVRDAADPRVRRILVRLARVHFPRVVRENLTTGRRLLSGDLARQAEGGERAALSEALARLERIAELHTAYDSLAGRFFGAIEAEDAEAADGLLTELERSGRRLGREIRLLDLLISGRVAAAAARAERAGSDATWAVILLTLLAAVVGAVVMAIAATAVRPLGRLTESVRKLAAGEAAPRVVLKRRDEVGLLAEEFNRLLQALSDRDARLEQQRADLLRAERLAAVGRIAAQVAHEIRNPLSSVSLNVELLAEETAAGNPDTGRLVVSIGKEVDRLTEITEEYLRFARLPEPELAPMSLKALLSDLLTFLGPSLEERSVDLETRIADDLPDLLADEEQLRRAFLNLMRNSIDAMPDGGRLRIEASYDAEANTMKTRITDTGAGIPPEVLDRVFDPFFSTKERGTGLGLALTQQIVAEHNGRIDVESHLGEGTTFVLQLPVVGERDSVTAP